MNPQDQSYYDEIEAYIALGNLRYSPPQTDEDKALVEAFLSTDFSKKPLDQKKSISIKMPISILAKLKEQSRRDAIPYQTLLISIAKKYTDGRLVEKD